MIHKLLIGAAAALCMAGVAVAQTSGQSGGTSTSPGTMSPGTNPGMTNQSGGSMNQNQGSMGTTNSGSALSQQDRMAVKDYATKHKQASTRISESVAIGATLPQNVQLHQIEGQAAMAKYRYTVVNDKTVLVDPSTRRVVEIIE